MGLGEPDRCEGNGNAVALSAQELRRTGRTLEAAMGKNDLLSKLSRYETHLVRQFERILDQISRNQTDGLRRQGRGSVDSRY